jgi:hypothetical protein
MGIIALLSIHDATVGVTYTAATWSRGGDGGDGGDAGAAVLNGLRQL